MSIFLGPVKVWLNGELLDPEVVDVRMSVEPVITSAPPATVADESVDDGLGSYDEDWFCVATDSYACPADGCGFVASFMTAAHLIVVWPSADDSALLGAAANAREVGRNPRVVAYKQEFGKAISWDEWDRRGRPVHGRADRPDGWEDRPWKI